MLTTKEYWTPAMSAPVYHVYRGRKNLGFLMSSRVGFNTVTNRPVYRWSFMPEKGVRTVDGRWATRDEALSALDSQV